MTDLDRRNGLDRETRDREESAQGGGETKIWRRRCGMLLFRVCGSGRRSVMGETRAVSVGGDPVTEITDKQHVTSLVAIHSFGESRVLDNEVKSDLSLLTKNRCGAQGRDVAPAPSMLLINRSSRPLHTAGRSAPNAGDQQEG